MTGTAAGRIDRLAAGPDQSALQALTRVHALLTDRNAPRKPSPPLPPLGSGEATATMSRTQAKIQRLSDRIGAHLALAQNSRTIGPNQVEDMRARLYCACTSCGRRKLLHPRRGRTPIPLKQCRRSRGIKLILLMAVGVSPAP